MKLDCWICGAPADSREHKFKRTDLARSSQTWATGDLPYLFDARGTRRLQSPHSHHATFGKVLCGDCNSAKTQPFDQAYEKFSAWVNGRGKAILAMDELDFAPIFGSQASTSLLDLQKYFVKQLGCRLASEHFAIPSGLAASLWSQDLAPFEISLARNELFRGLSIRGPGVLGNYPLLGTYSIASGTAKGPYLTGSVVGYLDVVVRYDVASRYSWEGDRLDHRKSRARLGLYADTNPDAHLADGHLPVSSLSRTLRLGDRDFRIPSLSIDHIRYLASLPKPEPELPLAENLDRKLRIAHAILSPLFPDLTLQFLEDNMSLPDADALWQLAFRAGTSP
jgi:hypothetical protein